MGLASVIHSSVRALPKYDPISFRVLSISPSKCVTVQFAHPSFYIVGHGVRGRNYPIACTRATEQEDDLSTSGIRDSVEKVKSFREGDDLGNEGPKGEEDYKTSMRTVALCVGTAVTFGIGIVLKDGVSKGSEFFAGYILEQSLSVDNLFVFVLIFNYFKVPLKYQNRVLSYGIAGAIIFRSSLILLGTATLQRFEAVNLLLAVILLYSSFKLFSSEEDDSDLSDNFVVKTCQRFIPVTSYYDGNKFLTSQNGVWKATPLLLTVAVIELSDIAFAVDSIPAVFGVTRDPFIVFTSNLFAILGNMWLFFSP
ncbi:hypothetical protein K2173_019660 [Erythroxylum novogranatense]|uniref:Thylakoid membrane protein TERC, chloroplastic n=1 Tax=Erythroxylum novogranatense TaxID=1862640 RepID=A0AAV8UBU3_9ROSI|nr:hypothetical protein K2173_019660 [Erythroxylum novogranatense]